MNTPRISRTLLLCRLHASTPLSHSTRRVVGSGALAVLVSFNIATSIYAADIFGLAHDQLTVRTFCKPGEQLCEEAASDQFFDPLRLKSVTGSAEAGLDEGSHLAQLLAFADATIGGGDFASAKIQLDFSFFVLQVGTPPVPVSRVRLNFDTTLIANVSPGGILSSAEAEAQLMWEEPPAGSSPLDARAFFILGFGNQLRQAFIATEPLLMVPGQIASAEYIAAVSLSTGGDDLASGYASLDPQIYIDPTFPYKDDFEIVFSPNLVTTVTTPEPGTAP